MKTAEKVEISRCIQHVNNIHPQRLGWFGPRIGMLLILCFAAVMLPFYLYVIFFNKVYFWIRRQQPIAADAYFNYDRHKLPHLSFTDKLWCEYCEWANGCLQWAGDIVHEIERRYCPIQNHCHPHCEKAKQWRDEFLAWNHKPEELVHYYEDRYLQESNVDRPAPPEVRKAGSNGIK